MSTATASEIRTFVLDRVSGELAARGLTPDEVPDDFDLLAEEALDSFGLLELIGEIERRYGLELAFDDVDPDDLTSVGPFSRLVAAQGASLAARSNGSAGNGVAPASMGAPGPRPVTIVAGRRGGRGSLGRFVIGGYRAATRGRDKLFSLAAAGGFAGFGRRSVVQLPVRLKNEQRIVIGNDVFIGANSWLQVLDADEGGIEIGNGASFAGSTVLSAALSIRIGTNVSLARNVYIADHAHAYDGRDVPVLLQGIKDIAPVEIGDGSWLGENVVVLPGVTIGAGAVVGANSVVSIDVPPRSLALGIPARVVRRFGDDPGAAGPE